MYDNLGGQIIMLDEDNKKQCKLRHIGRNTNDTEFGWDKGIDAF